MADGGHELIIVRRHEEEEHEHHSSAWKVAHADFMTAMMAFFLIMWLINVTDDQVRKGISEYFNPIHMSQGSSDLKGLNKPEPGQDGKAAKGHNDIQLPGAAMNLLKLSAGHSDSKSVSPEDAAAAIQAAAEVVATAAAEAARLESANGAKAQGDQAKNAGAGAKAGDRSPGPGGEARGNADAGTIAEAAGRPGNGISDRVAFQDPYAALAKLAQEFTADHPMSADAIDGDTRPVGVESGAVDRDPFDPTYWQMSALPAARATNPGAPGSAEPPPDARPDAAAMSPPAPAGDAVKPAEAASAPEPGAVTPSDMPSAAEPAQNVKADAIAAAQVASSRALGAAIEKSVKGIMAADASPALTVKATPEGIAVSLTDDPGYSMFPVGSAVPDGKMVVLLDRIAKVLSDRKGQIVIRGYTDGRPFHSADYDNWRLSAARAHMAYYMLTRGGLPESRIEAIEGHADRSLKNAADPFAAENRRIEILIKEEPQ